MSRKTMLYIWLTAIAIMTVSCQNEPNIAGPDNMSAISDPIKISLDIPKGAQLDSAIFHVRVNIPNRQNINLHRITTDWAESGEGGVTWNSFAGSYAPEVIGSFNADVGGWKSVDISDLIQGWIDDTYPCHGILLKQPEQNYPNALLSSREVATNKPFILVCYTLNNVSSCDTMFAEADTYIYESGPDHNFGNETVLFTGWATPSTLEKQALIRFGIITTSQEEQEYVSIGDFVWADDNMNGIQDEGEAGIPDVEMRLFDCLDILIASTTTDENGFYLFDSLDPVGYYVSVTAPDGYLFSPADQGVNDSLDSDINPETGLTACTVLEGNQSDHTMDAGLYLPVVDDDEEESCTRSRSYWKRHTGLESNDDLVTQYLPIWLGAEDGHKSVLVSDAKTAANILRMKHHGRRHGAYRVLYAQLLTAKLNIANGADGADINDVISEVDEFLAKDNSNGGFRAKWFKFWKMLRWKYKLTAYNNGKIGPGSCVDDNEALSTN